MDIKTFEDRKSIPENYKWDLDSLYKTTEEYYKDVEASNKILEKLKKYKGKVLASAKNLLNILSIQIELDLLLDKMANYVHLNSELDTRDSFYDSLLKELIDFYSNVSLELNFISDELKSLTDELLDRFIKEEPKLKAYEFGLRHTIKMNKHLLSLECENLLSSLSPVLDAGEDIFSKLDDADSDYGEVLDKEGHSHKLTGSSFSKFVSGEDRVLRKNADEKMHEYYKNHANTFAACLSNHVKTGSILSKIRGYESTLEASLSSDNITPTFYKNFIKEVNDNLDVLHRMMKIYKKAFKLDEMHIYDTRCRLESGVKVNYTIEEMQSILKNALGPLGGEYLSGVNEAFENNWVDYYETPGKRSGAFSTTTIATKPYLLLNYTGTFDDLETFAHELGHSMHTYFSNKYRSPIDANYPIFLAEIASTTNELLLNHYLLNSTDDKRFKRFILNNLLSMYRATIFRQTEFAEFESIIFERCENGENLSKDDFTQIYYDLQKKYYGDGVIQDDYIKYECFRIPHFYYNFYVYKYATSLAIAYRFASGIINNDEKVKANYIKFLSSGGKDYPMNILKECGIDLDSENILDYSINIIKKYLDEFERLLD